MIVVFRTKKLDKQCNNETERQKAFGTERAKKIGLRLDQIRFSECLKDFIQVHPRCHPLKGDRQGQWSADLDHPYRLIFDIADEPIPREEQGGIDTSQVHAVKIIEVADTHGN